MYRYSRRMSDGSEVWAELVVWAVVLLVLVGWLAVRGTWMVVQALAQHRDHEGLWRTFWVWVGSVAALGLVGLAAGAGLLSTSVASGAALVAGTAVGISTVLLLIVSRMVSAVHQQLFSAPREKLTTTVLQRPWWPPLDGAA